MKFKEFVDWCNQRACDGCWGMNVAMYCIDVIGQIRKLPFWKREKAWQELNADSRIEEVIVNPINRKIAELLNRESGHE